MLTVRCRTERCKLLFVACKLHYKGNYRQTKCRITLLSVWVGRGSTVVSFMGSRISLLPLCVSFFRPQTPAKQAGFQGSPARRPQVRSMQSPSKQGENNVLQCCRLQRVHVAHGCIHTCVAKGTTACSNCSQTSGSPACISPSSVRLAVERALKRASLRVALYPCPQLIPSHFKNPVVALTRDHHSLTLGPSMCYRSPSPIGQNPNLPKITRTRQVAAQLHFYFL